MEVGQSRQLCPANAALVGYTFVRHVGFILDELSAQGLTVWQDDRHVWRWHWRATDLRSERGFWALGEAIVDAVITRYPSVFATELDEAVE